MHELLERLGRGDVRLIEMCQQANQAWREFLTELQRLRHGHACCAPWFLPADDRAHLREQDTRANHDAVERLCQCSSIRRMAGGRTRSARCNWRRRSRGAIAARKRSDEARSCVISYELETRRRRAGERDWVKRPRGATFRSRRNAPAVTANGAAARRVRANPATLPLMAKRKTSQAASPPARRDRPQLFLRRCADQNRRRRGRRARRRSRSTRRSRCATPSMTACTTMSP